MSQQSTSKKSITLPITQPPTPPSSPGLLMTPEELAEWLHVPLSWVREQTRARARVRDADPLPCVRLGKYVRFSRADVEAWLQRRAGE